MYSDISIRTMAFSSSKRFWARDLASSVLPTPVGPKKRKEPMGLVGSLIPALERRIASVTLVTASSCPISLLWISSSRWSTLERSDSFNLVTGIPVQRLMILAISSSVTLSCTKPWASLLCASSSASCNSRSTWGRSWYCSFATFS